MSTGTAPDPHVIISVHGRWHAFDLAAGLGRKGHLEAVITTYPALIARRYLPEGVEISAKPSLEIRRRLFDRLGLGTRPDVPIAKSIAAHTAQFLERHAGGRANILVGWSSATLEAMPVARQQGLKVALERGSTHINHQVKVLGDAYKELGISGPLPAPEIVDRELAEYQLADRVFVASNHSRQTFIDHGVPGEKIAVNQYGVDLSRFELVDRTGDRPVVRVLFVGGVDVRKGVPWLLRAFSRLPAIVELRLVGPIEPNLRNFLSQYANDRIDVAGPLSGARLEEAYRTADIFCMPSLEEGGVPMASLEAMASGLPVVTTAAAGGGHLIEHERHGLVVPSADDRALGDAVQRLAESKSERVQFGLAARSIAEKGYSWENYCNRAETHYRQMLAE